MKTITILLLLFCSISFAQPAKRNPPPFDKSMSVYTQTNVQDTLFNKHVLPVGYGGSGNALKILSADSATTGQALIGSPLGFAKAANSRYYISGVAQISSSATSGVKLGIRIPSGDTVSLVFNGSDSSNLQNKWSLVSIDSGLTDSYVDSIGTGYVKFEGYVSGATAGNVYLGFLKITSGTATLKKNSIIAWRRIY